MDWVNYLPTIVTGVVGLAGIGGAILSARMASKSTAANLQTSIDAENNRAKIAEKRRIYAKYLASTVDLIVAASNLEGCMGQPDSPDRAALSARVDVASAALVNSLSELHLVASEALRQQAEDVGRILGRHAEKIQGGKQSDPEFFKLRPVLVRAMRVDLGESVEQ